MQGLQLKGALEDRANEIIELLVKKNNDYGNSFDEQIDKFGMVSYLIRIQDKINRLAALTNGKNRMVSDESIEDTVKDIAGYSLLMMNKLFKEYM